ncbi:MAG: Cof-type HAD-IIB family hydrolase, partial [Ruminococcus sp.]|nr:Cof-type HAD-IIB family hydrolase [Ruminococcus sp.]
MEKKLYISDLDGTLLDSDGKLSDYTINTLNNLIENGVYFTFATARTIYSAKPITEGLNINVPCILNNGASIYDIQSGEYVKNAYFKQSTAEKVLSVFRNNGVYCFVFKFIDEILVTCYDKITNESMQKFVDERKGQYEKPFRECDDLASEIDEKVIYINAMGDYETLLPIRNAVAEIDGADFAFYKDTYTDCWFLEIFSSEASKANGIKFLRKKYGFTKIIAFGDNFNDLSMFKEADVKIAVDNAKPELKDKADLIIDTNDNNGVADWLDREVNFKMSYKNVYGTDEYIRYINKYMPIFDEKNLTEINSY